MAGILDNKKRIMDTIVTQEGRRQLSSGNFKIKYASFTDGNVFYEEDLLSGTTDATLRIPFEVVNKFQDNIVFETDDSGNLLSFQGNGVELNADGSIVSLTATYPNDTRIYNGKVVVEVKGQNSDGLDYFYYYDETTEKIVYWVHGYADDADGGSGATGVWDETGTEDSDGYGWFLTDDTYAWPISAPKSSILSTDNFITSIISSRSVISDSEGFSSTVDSITSASFDSFNQQNFITTRTDREQKKFSVTSNKNEFTYTIKSGYDNEIIEKVNLNSLPTFINDVKLSNVPNFKFLPPINKNDSSKNGIYKNRKEDQSLSLTVSTDISSIFTLPPLISPMVTILGSSQSLDLNINSGHEGNKLLLQVFEAGTNSKKITKLDMIDAGEIYTDGVYKRIIFLGKTIIDSYEQPTFVNIFTLEILK